jgi:hypothetical protein
MGDSDRYIYFAPRFHVNFYHSYRGDTPDEKGFGKDIRIIRGILDDLDCLSADGIVVHCAWDFDNVFSLGEMIPQYAPDIISRIQKRVSDGIDEIHHMSWNNGLLSVHTTEEARQSIRWTLTNEDRSGNCDLFENCAPIVRPQECMITPSHPPLYLEAGIEVLSVYYSAIPFNGIGSFMPRLSVAERYNPLRWVNMEGEHQMRLLPAINQGDLVEWGLSARRMLKSIRKGQSEGDLIVLLDMDADDTFWAGMVPSGLKSLVPSFAGLERLIRSIADLPYVRFIRPNDYLKTHDDVGTVTFGQDLADGAFDGFASWAEKHDNHLLWEKINEARTHWERAKGRVLGALALDEEEGDDFDRWTASLSSEVRSLAQEALTTRLRVLSTTHFGLSAPVMNTHRLEAAYTLVDRAIELAQLLDEAVAELYEERAHSPEAIDWSGPSLSLTEGEDGTLTLHRDDHQITIKTPWVEYASQIRKSEQGQPISLGDENSIQWQRQASLDEITQTVIIDCKVSYPETQHRRYNKNKAQHLLRTWDGRWQQLAPCEVLVFETERDTVLSVWKADFGGVVSSYRLEYWQWGKNQTLPSINNHVTPSWIAVSDGKKGVLIAQNRTLLHGWAFCPLRQVIKGERQQLLMNPLGTYWGEQYHYPNATTGWGRIAAQLTAEHLYSSAPSWTGREVHFSLMVAPYEGDSPPSSLQALAEHFSQSGRVH